jgi:hypothetical protein
MVFLNLANHFIILTALVRRSTKRLTGRPRGFRRRGRASLALIFRRTPATRHALSIIHHALPARKFLAGLARDTVSSPEAASGPFPECLLPEWPDLPDPPDLCDLPDLSDLPDLLVLPVRLVTSEPSSEPAPSSFEMRQAPLEQSLVDIVRIWSEIS